MTYTLRYAIKEDAPRIAAIHVESWRHGYKGIIHQAWLDHGLDISKQTERWTSRLEAGRKETILVFDNKRLAGFVTAGPSRNENYPGYAELYAIYIDPACYGRGAGTALFRACVEYVINLGFGKMFVNVLKDNSAGRRFYEKMGGVHVKNSEEELSIGGRPYTEIKYVWEDLKR